MFIYWMLTCRYSTSQWPFHDFDNDYDYGEYSTSQWPFHDFDNDYDYAYDYDYDYDNDYVDMWILYRMTFSWFW